MTISAYAGKVAPSHLLIDVEGLISAYFDLKPDANDPAQQISFGTSGHRGSSLDRTFNRPHILAITQAVCDYRRKAEISGPLYLGIDTHALSRPALETALEVLIANGVETMIQKESGYTPTPVISHAILTHNLGRESSLADGIVITPSHNPPQDGGYKYNPPHGGPAEAEITDWIEKRANFYLKTETREVKTIPLQKALRSPELHEHNFLTPYVADLAQVVDMDAIRSSGLRIGVDPMGGANVDFWAPIAELYGVNLEVVNARLDPKFGFMSVDKDGKIRMDCSSPYAMAGLISLKNKFDLAFGTDTDSDRHGIVTPTAGLMNPNHYLAVAISYLYTHRPLWKPTLSIGKTLVSSAMIDRVAGKLGRKLSEVPVGFKWFVDGLHSGQFGFAGEESAGASFLRRNGNPWTTDKDGIILCLLAAEITAVTGSNPGQLYDKLTEEFGRPIYERLDAPANANQRKILQKLSPEDVRATTLAGEPILQKLTRAPGNDAPIGGLKVVTQNGWFAARPSGTENVYKIYTESFLGKDHLAQIQIEAKAIVQTVMDSL